MSQRPLGLFFGVRGPERCQEFTLSPAGEILVGQLDQAQTAQFNTLNKPLSWKGVKDDGCTECGWSHTFAAAWCLVCCPEAFAREDTRAGEPQGLGRSLDMEVLFLEEP